MKIQVDPQAPDFAKSNPKSKIIWPKQYKEGWNRASLTEYPEKEAEISAWRKGIDRPGKRA